MEEVEPIRSSRGIFKVPQSFALVIATDLGAGTSCEFADGTFEPRNMDCGMPLSRGGERNLN